MVFGQVGKPGAQSGTGILAVADWELETAWVLEDGTEAAATPARTTVKATMRMASFIKVTSLNSELAVGWFPRMQIEYLVCVSKSSTFIDMNYQKENK
ncbi:MAG: hypothetical protein P4L26_05610 [Terracidiphilus sp.]|nr:hypothetical protein [Terracidiphilus sp.]